MKNNLCDGCNVRKPFEHRCHGEGSYCKCSSPSCMVKQGRMTEEIYQKLVSFFIRKKKVPILINPDPGGDHSVLLKEGSSRIPIFWGTKAECEAWQKENCT